MLNILAVKLKTSNLHTVNWLISLTIGLMVTVQKHRTQVVIPLIYALNVTNFEIDLSNTAFRTCSIITVLHETDKTLASYITLHLLRCAN